MPRAGCLGRGRCEITITPGANDVPGFTNDAGAGVAGTITKVEYDYPDNSDATTHGKFAISADQKSILYTPPTKVGNIPAFDVEADYTAKDADGNDDTSTVTITVTPVNDPAEIAIVEPIAAINETEKLVFTIIVDDEEEGGLTTSLCAD